MPLTLTWEQIALRIFLAAIASLLIAVEADERGHPAGMRTTMLVCLAACLAQLQANMLLGTSGKTPSSFIQLDLERLPLGILSGIGFIGAGVIVKKDNNIVSGVTTAATIWFVSVLSCDWLSESAASRFANSAWSCFCCVASPACITLI